jgi:hypothetical protein
VTISPPSNGTNGSGGSGSEQDRVPIKKQVSTGAIVGIVVAVLVLLALAGSLLYVFLRRRKRSQPPVELPALAPTIVVDHPTGETLYGEPQDLFFGRAHDSFPPDKKPEWEPIPPVPQELHHQRSELSTATEIYQLAERDNREGTYDAEAERMNSSRRSTNTSELPGSAVLFELEADPVGRDARMRDLLSSPAPTFSSRHTESTLSPFDTPLPVSPQSVSAERSQSRSPVQSEPMSWLAITPTDSPRRGFRAQSPDIPISPEPENQDQRPINSGGTPSPRSRWFNTRETGRPESPRVRDRFGSHIGDLYSP